LPCTVAAHGIIAYRSTQRGQTLTPRRPGLELDPGLASRSFVAGVTGECYLCFLMRARLPWCAWMICSSTSLHALAADELSLTWDAPVGCASKERVERALDELVPDGRVALSVDVRVREQAGVWRAEILTKEGARSLEGATCEEVVLAVQAIIALALQPATVDGGEPRGPSADDATAPEYPVPARPQATAEPRAAPPARTPPNRGSHPPSRWRFGLLSRAMAEIGALPSVTAGAALGARVGTRATFAELSALALWPRDVELAYDPARGGTVGLQAGQVRGCTGPGGASIFSGCLLFEVGRMTGKGSGVDHVMTGSALWLAPGGALTFRFLGQTDFHAEADFSAMVALRRPEFTLEGVDSAFQPALISARAAVTIGWR
jgi:hypothetical protein